MKQFQKIAIVHDWLTGMRGGERCLSEFLKIYPNSDIFTLVHDIGTTSKKIDDAVKQQSWIGKLPYGASIYRHLLPLYPLATRSLNLRGYDLVISLSHAAAKNVIIPKNTKHFSYCFTPMRYIWDQSDIYFGKYSYMMQPLLNYLRAWDKRGSNSVDKFSAISSFVAARIRAYYGRNSSVINPPVRTDWIRPLVKWRRGDSFLYAGALVPYKKPDVVVEAFNRLGLPLIVAGKGSMLKSLRDNANSNIIFIDNASDLEFAELYRTCRALVFPAIEDFGMIPVECMAAGRPVIGLDRGGLKESINGIRLANSLNYINDLDRVSSEKITGVLLSARSHNLVEEVINGVKFFEKIEDNISIENCINQSKKFSAENFFTKWNQFVEQ